jgi:hypothetical protein
MGDAWRHNELLIENATLSNYPLASTADSVEAFTLNGVNFAQLAALWRIERFPFRPRPGWHFPADSMT